MPKLKFEDYVNCFRKQFIFQKGKFGRRTSSYHTDNNWEQGMNNDHWGMIIFIHCGTLYGFTDEEMMAELKIKSSLYEVLKEEIPKVLHPAYSDYNMYHKVKVKIGLVKNTVLINHHIRPERKVI